jgi:hypothetical protein
MAISRQATARASSVLTQSMPHAKMRPHRYAHSALCSHTMPMRYSSNASRQLSKHVKKKKCHGYGSGLGTATLITRLRVRAHLW